MSTLQDTPRRLNRNAYTATGEPRYLRIYDQGDAETQARRVAAGKQPHPFVDRYTVVFTQLRFGEQQYLAMSGAPFHPQGFCQHGHAPSYQPIDRPTYGHLGKKIRFAELPEACQRAVMQDYTSWWGVWTPLEGEQAP